MKTLLITGANRGLGFDFTRRMAETGWHIHACCRAPAQADGLQALAAKHDVTIHALDVADFGQIDALKTKLGDEPIDVLFNNAGIMETSQRTLSLDHTNQMFDSLDEDEWMAVMRVNTMAPLRMCEVFVDNVAASDRKQILMMSSIVGSIGSNQTPRWYHYGTSKTALNMVMRNLAADLKDRGISVVSLHPGWTQTDMGGPTAALSIDESVGGLFKVVETLTPNDSGRFIAWNGDDVPW
ncbi:MAG: SDR family oxidoreductase [Proteobacteria bacterium]|nr:SDR family oxidoreductase [Pseudomonadota bacterium]MDA1057603.1 SDR family oxidoreductase [Pseudomonadota bacterium]